MPVIGLDRLFEYIYCSIHSIYFDSPASKLLGQEIKYTIIINSRKCSFIMQYTVSVSNDWNQQHLAADQHDGGSTFVYAGKYWGRVVWNPIRKEAKKRASKERLNTLDNFNARGSNRQILRVK